MRGGAEGLGWGLKVGWPPLHGSTLVNNSLSWRWLMSLPVPARHSGTPWHFVVATVEFRSLSYLCLISIIQSSRDISIWKRLRRLLQDASKGVAARRWLKGGFLPFSHHVLASGRKDSHVYDLRVATSSGKKRRQLYHWRFQTIR